MCYRPPRNGGAEKVTSSFEVLSELAIMLAFVVVGTWPYAISSRLAWPGSSARAAVRFLRWRHRWHYLVGPQLNDRPPLPCK